MGKRRCTRGNNFFRNWGRHNGNLVGNEALVVGLSCNRRQRLWKEWSSSRHEEHEEASEFLHVELPWVYRITLTSFNTLKMSVCPHLRELSPLELLPNLKYLKLIQWPNLKQLGIGNSERERGFLKLEKMVLSQLPRLESLTGPSNIGLWNEEIWECPSLKRLPRRMDKLVSLSTLFGTEAWWQGIIWQDDNMKSHLQNLSKL